MSDYTYLIPELLAQGSAPPDGVQLPFDVVVLAAREYQPSLPGVEIIRVPLSDDGPPPTPQERALIDEHSARIVRRLRAGKRVLVTCWLGKNRSGVLAGRALVALGMAPAHAIALIQRTRKGLTNPYFEAIVRDRAAY